MVLDLPMPTFVLAAIVLFLFGWPLLRRLQLAIKTANNRMRAAENDMPVESDPSNHPSI
jgi:hypothetical protein